MLPCTICSTPFAYARACDQAHPGVCHWCAEANFSGHPLDNSVHPAPRETPPLALTQRELAAVSAYQRRVLALVGPLPLAGLLLPEED